MVVAIINELLVFFLLVVIILKSAQSEVIINNKNATFGVGFVSYYNFKSVTSKSIPILFLEEMLIV
jgi:preprotein translocase subunit SecY